MAGRSAPAYWRPKPLIYPPHAGAADGAKLVVSVLGNVTGAASETRQSAESVLSASQAVEAAAAELRHEVEGFLARVAA